MSSVTGVVQIDPGVADTGARLGGRLREIFRSRRLLAGVCIVGVFAGVGIVGPFLVQNANALSNHDWASPSLSHWLGTNEIGQDVFAQLVVSARASLEIGAGPA